MPVPDESCAVGHVAPDWTEAARAIESATEGRCLVTATEPGPYGWSLCGGIDRTGVPAICPVVPGGLGVAWVPKDTGRWGGPAASVVLDCPGRYRIERRDAEVAVVPEATGAGACPASESGPVDPTGLAVSDPTGNLVPRLPEPLRKGGFADLTTWGKGAEGTLTAVWQTGSFRTVVAGFDLLVGRDVPWQALDVAFDADSARVSETPNRLTPNALRTPAGKPVELATWAGLAWTDSGGWIADPVPMRLPEAIACGARIAAGTFATLDADPHTTQLTRACRGTPSTPAESVRIGPDAVHLEWNAVPEKIRPARKGPPETPGWLAEGPDVGCELVCRAP